MQDNQLLSEFLSLVNVEDFDKVYAQDIKGDSYFGMPLKGILEAEKALRNSQTRNIAYFSMEYGLASSFYNQFKSSREIHPSNKFQEQEIFSNFRIADYFFTLKVDNLIDLPIYSGGLGVLAGDTIKTMADYKLPAVGIGILWYTGYFRQKFWFKYGQVPEKIHWDFSSYPGLIPLKEKIKIKLRDRDLILKIWKYYVYSYKGDYAIPLLLLDANIEENSQELRSITDQLYRSDNPWTKLMQRIVLGMGGVLALTTLGYQIDIYHLNEGQAVFAFLQRAKDLGKEKIEELKKHFYYTCHTPVAAGHDKFSTAELRKVLEDCDYALVEKYGKEKDASINLTLLAMNISSSINAVSLNHQKVMHIQFPKYKDKIQYVTNGVYHHTWISDSFKELFEKYKDVFSDIKANPMALERIKELRNNEKFRLDLWQAHQANKREGCTILQNWRPDENAFTICWARRVAAYKRPSLILADINKLLEISRNIGPIQIVFAGKAHPKDDMGFTYINQMLEKVDSLNQVYEYLKIVMLENYEIFMAKHLVSSVDVWLNNPLPPFEASGTSGMKAIMNGVIQISTYDGWVVEAADKNIGRIFGYRNKEGEIGDEFNLRINEDAQDLYRVLAEMVELYYQTNKKGQVDIHSSWIDMMIDCIATASHFNTYRMLDEYKAKIWHLV